MTSPRHWAESRRSRSDASGLWAGIATCIQYVAKGVTSDAPPRRPSQRPPFPADSWANERARSDPARARSPDHRSPRARVRATDAGDPRGAEENLSDRWPSGDLFGLGHRSLGSCDFQYALTR